MTVLVVDYLQLYYLSGLIIFLDKKYPTSECIKNDHFIMLPENCCKEIIDQRYTPQNSILGDSHPVASRRPAKSVASHCPGRLTLSLQIQSPLKNCDYHQQ